MGSAASGSAWSSRRWPSASRARDRRSSAAHYPRQRSTAGRWHPGGRSHAPLTGTRPFRRGRRNGYQMKRATCLGEGTPARRRTGSAGRRVASPGRNGSSPRSPRRFTVLTCRCSISATSDAVSSFPTSFVIIRVESFRHRDYLSRADERLGADGAASGRIVRLRCRPTARYFRSANRSTSDCTSLRTGHPHPCRFTRSTSSSAPAGSGARRSTATASASAALKDAVRAAGLADRIRINHAGCFSQCGNGPMAVVYPEGPGTPRSPGGRPGDRGAAPGGWRAGRRLTLAGDPGLGDKLARDEDGRPLGRRAVAGGAR